MLLRRFFLLVLMAAILLTSSTALGDEISVEGGPVDSGFNVGSVATIRATVKGIAGDAGRYTVFAEIQYAGTTSTTSVQMDRAATPRQGEAEYEIGWPIPAEAPTGLYTVAVRVQDRTTHRTVILQPLRGFAAYKKLILISHLNLDRTFYNLGEPIQCQLTLENLTDAELTNLRVEFSNANYPWISLFSREANGNSGLALKVLRDHLTLAARGTATIPMTSAGTASFLQGKEKRSWASAPPSATKRPRRRKWIPTRLRCGMPTTPSFTIWPSLRPPLCGLRKAISPYPTAGTSSSLTTPILTSHGIGTFTRQGRSLPSSPWIPRTLYRPGDQVKIEGELKNSEGEAWNGAELRATISDAAGKEVQKATLLSGINLGAGQTLGGRWMLGRSPPIRRPVLTG